MCDRGLEKSAVKYIPMSDQGSYLVQRILGPKAQSTCPRREYTYLIAGTAADPDEGRGRTAQTWMVKQ